MVAKVGQFSVWEGLVAIGLLEWTEGRSFIKIYVFSEETACVVL